jgi:AI-2 transport protein TqsA
LSTAISQERPRSTATAAATAVIAVILGTYALKVTYFVSMPIALSFFLFVLVSPVNWYVRSRVPRRLRALGVVVAMVVLVVSVGIVLGSFAMALRMAAQDAPHYTRQIQSAYEQTLVFIDQALPLFDPQSLEDINISERVVEWITRLLMALWSMVALGVLVFFLVLLMLMEERQWRCKVRAAFGPVRGRQVLRATHIIASQVRWYLLTATALGAVTGAAAGLWLWVVGVPDALVWGVIIFVANYIPYLGSIIGEGLPVVAALLQRGWSTAIMAAVGMLALEQVVGNFLRPRVTGRVLRMSPVVVLVALVFWYWVWGIAGAVLAIPLTAAMIVTCSQVPALRPVSLLLSRHSRLDGVSSNVRPPATSKRM